MRLDRFDRFHHLCDGVLEWNGRLMRGQAVFVGIAHLAGYLGALDQGFRRYAAKVQTVSAHFVRFNQSDLCFDCRTDE